MRVSYSDVRRAIERLENDSERILSVSIIDSRDSDIQVLVAYAKQQLQVHDGQACEVVTGRSGHRQVIVKGKR